MGNFSKAIGVGLAGTGLVLSGSYYGPGYGLPTREVPLERPATEDGNIVDPPENGTVVPAPTDLVRSSSSSLSYRDTSPTKIAELERCGVDTNKVLLTFDDTGTPEHINNIKQFLAAKNIGAVFFPNNKLVSQTTVDAMRADGFWVGNHTYSHAKLTELPEAALQEEINKGIDSDLVRPPYGAVVKYEFNGENIVDPIALSRIEAMGRRVCMWTVDSGDTAATSAQEIVVAVEKGIGLSDPEQGVVILAHMLPGKKTLEALPGIVDAVARSGREFCKLSATPTAPGPMPNPLPC